MQRDTMKCKRIPYLGVRLSVMLALALSAQATVIYVDADTDPSGTGTGWGMACADLQDALTAARPGDVILVAAGVYYPDQGTGERSRSFELGNEVSVYGGYAGQGELNPDLRDQVAYPSILSGDIGVVEDISDNSYHVVTSFGGGVSGLLDGFVITGGNANAGYPDDGGGGLLNTLASLTLVNCTFCDNWAGSGGGAALLNRNNASSTVTNCGFLRNTANGEGGALASFGGTQTLVQCDFLDNISDLGGGAIYSVSASLFAGECRFAGNWAELYGGAWHIYLGTVRVEDCQFLSNSVLNDWTLDADGGGALYNNAGDLTLVGCQFIDNITSDCGGAIYNTEGTQLLVNCKLAENWALDEGGGIYSRGGSLTLANCTLIGNTSLKKAGGFYNREAAATLDTCTFFANWNNGTSGAGGFHNVSADPIITNCIFWRNRNRDGTNETAQLAHSGEGQLAVNYCCVQGLTGSFGGEGNINTDPSFLDPTGADGIEGTSDDDLRLPASSTSVNAGSDAALPSDVLDLDQDSDTQEPLPVDLDWDERIVGARVDQGSYECLDGEYERGDMNCDRQLDWRDIDPFTLALVGEAVYCEKYPDCNWLNADCNYDGDVTWADIDPFLQLISTSMSLAPLEWHQPTILSELQELAALFGE
ncbi:MAG: hypothetical protein KAY37_10670 [Phycisphaerae bacterium]|nr:hypothetical protein [Phycisphaerae bacterium]